MITFATKSDIDELKKEIETLKSIVCRTTTKTPALPSSKTVSKTTLKTRKQRERSNKPDQLLAMMLEGRAYNRHQLEKLSGWLCRLKQMKKIKVIGYGIYQKVA